jgi:hypothetical protein
MTNLIAILSATWLTGATNTCTTNGWIATSSSLYGRAEIAAGKIVNVWLQAGGRMSEINETVAVVTNVVKADNGVPSTTWKFGGMVVTNYLNDSPAVLTWPNWTATPATERTETTTVTERRTLRFRWSGEWRELTAERVLERKVRRWVLKNEWREE